MSTGETLSRKGKGGKKSTCHSLEFGRVARFRRGGACVKLAGARQPIFPRSCTASRGRLAPLPRDRPQDVQGDCTSTLLAVKRSGPTHTDAGGRKNESPAQPGRGGAAQRLPPGAERGAGVLCNWGRVVVAAPNERVTARAPGPGK